MASYFGYLEGGFERVGDDVSDATRTGDLVLANDGGGVARHLYVLVEPSRGTFLTAAHGYGVIAVRRWTISGVSGVYRIKEASE